MIKDIRVKKNYKITSRHSLKTATAPAIFIIRTKCFIMSLQSAVTHQFSQFWIWAYPEDMVISVQTPGREHSMSQQQQQQQVIPGPARAAAPLCSGGWDWTERRETLASEHQRWSSTKPTDSRRDAAFLPHCSNVLKMSLLSKLHLPHCMSVIFWASLC